MLPSLPAPDLTSLGSPPRLVLVVDDDPAILKVIKSQLEFQGYAVLTEETGTGAVEVVKNAKLSAVLLDLSLKDESGFDVLQEIKKLKPSLAVIMVTGSHEESEARKAFELGAYDYVTKPVDFKYLSNILLMQSPE